MGAWSAPVKMGTLQWKWHDNHGKVHLFDIPNSYYVPNCSHRLLIPQHWAQMMLKQCRGRTQETTDHRQTTLTWADGKYCLDIPLDQSNVATICLAAGYKASKSFLATVEINLHDNELVCYLASDDIVTDDRYIESVTILMNENCLSILFSLIQVVLRNQNSSKIHKLCGNAVLRGSC